MVEQELFEKAYQKLIGPFEKLPDEIMLKWTVTVSLLSMEMIESGYHAVMMTDCACVLSVSISRVATSNPYYIAPQKNGNLLGTARESLFEAINGIDKVGGRCWKPNLVCIRGPTQSH